MIRRYSGSKARGSMGYAGAADGVRPATASFSTLKCYQPCIQSRGEAEVTNISSVCAHSQLRPDNGDQGDEYYLLEGFLNRTELIRGKRADIDKI